MSSILGVYAKGACGEFGFEDLCCNMNGKQVYCLTIKLKYERHLHLNNSLLDMYVKSRDMDGAKNVFAHFSQSKYCFLGTLQ